MAQPPKKKIRPLSRAVAASVFDGDTVRDSTESLDAIRCARLETELRRKQALEAQRVKQQDSVTEAEAALEVGSSIDEYFNHFGDSGNAIGGMDVDDVDGENDVEPIEDQMDTFQLDEDQIEVVAQITTRRVHRHDRRTRRKRSENAWNGWMTHMPKLVQSYLDFVSTPRDKTKPSSNDLETNESPVSNERNTNEVYHRFEVRRISTHDYTDTYPVEQQKEEEANVALLRVGLLGSSPQEPHVAFTLEFLELYHQIRRRQSSFSIQAITKVICSLHNIRYTNTLRHQLSNTFDVYLEILRNVKKLVEDVLGRGGDWKLKHGCPPCGWKVENEPELQPARLHAIDGNNSLKRLDRAGTADLRVFHSDLVIPHTDVEKFKKNVSRPQPNPETPTTKTGVPSEATPADGDESACTDNWIAANAVREETVTVFDQTGVFACVCRHAMVETIVEMRKSGELAKYGLATLNKLLKVLEARQGVGYDIGCAFCKTVENSTLSQLAKDTNLRLVVDLFHGHAHNRLCQLNNLPLYLPGFGIEDFATCERVFSASNSVARVVRYASHFHWLQFIDLHYDQWNQDRYQDISKFLFENYRQAIQIIEAYTPDVEALKTSLGLENSDFLKWHEEEVLYLTSKSKAPEYDEKKLAYVTALEELAELNAVYQTMTQVPSFHAYNSNTGTMSDKDRREAQRISNERNRLRRKIVLFEDAAKEAEAALDVMSSWKPSDIEYKHALDFIKNQKFYAVVEKLEGLVVQRLFELAKANLSQTCYKMRRHISKALTKRSGAIRTALTKYNQLAPLQNPPRPTLVYEEVISYTLLGEFDVLKLSSTDILEKPWTKPTNREVAAKYFKTVRAEEEKVRLNVEIARLAAWIEHDERELRTIATQLEASRPTLAHQLHRMYSRQRRVNDIHRDYIQRIYKLQGFTGTRAMVEPANIVASGRDGFSAKEVDKEDDVLDVAEDDAAADEMQRLGDFMENLEV